MSYIHLHTHTQYSLLDGSGRLPELISHAKEMGMDSLAITDHGVMYGCLEFYKEAKKQGIRPILGCEIYVTPGSRFDREKNSDERYFHLVLLAENNEGYQNLIKIVTAGFIDGFYYRPRVDYEILKKYHKGIIALSACLAGEIARKLEKDDIDAAKEKAVFYEELFGKGNFFLELQDHGYEMQKKVNAGILRIAGETGIPMVVTNDVHYNSASDAAAHDVLLCIQTGKKVKDTDRMKYEGGQFYLKSEEEMRALFKYAPEAIENTGRIAERCHVEIEFGNYKLPHFRCPAAYEGNAKGYLRKLCEEGLKKRYPDTYEANLQRLDYELDTINTMGFTDYFLIVSDFIRYAKRAGIPVGPGRGSAAGSIVSYALEITDIDPLKYSLLFERFLNPERVSMPDIDVDFCYERRQEVIDYVIRTYGEDNVAQIVTFGTLAARGVIRDVGRAMDIQPSLIDKIARMIPAKPGTLLKDIASSSTELKELCASDREVRELIAMSLRLEGLPRHSSMHAAGVLITGERVDNFVPLSRNQDGTVVTQYTMTVLEEIGLLKMDFLGLRTLTVIHDTVSQIEKNHRVTIDPLKIDLNDTGVYEMISSGNTAGVFQLESAGMTAFMKELKPSSIDDIIAGLALYRPGPMDFIPDYIRGKEDPEGVTYDHPLLKPILESTYGCIVYQEQVMQIVQNLAGYTLGRADLVRRAMAKKKHDVMAKERKNFVYGNREENVAGCVNNGISEEAANRIFDKMTDFASYAFNKSHAAAYAVVSYQTAWLKKYYPSEFFSSLLTSVMGNSEKTAGYIGNMKAMGIHLSLPDINRGTYGFSSLPDGTVIYGLSAIKGVGKGAVDDIETERIKNGNFTGLNDFVKRMPPSVNKKSLESLIKAGAFDSLKGNRKQKLMILPSLVDQTQAARHADFEGQISLFDLNDSERNKYEPAFPEVAEFSKDELLALEKEASGMYLSGHPLEAYAESFRSVVNAISSDLAINEESGESRFHEGDRIICGGIINEKRNKVTKNGRTMAFLKMEDMYGSFDALAFPETYEKYAPLLAETSMVYVIGRATIGRDETVTVSAEKIVRIGDERKEIWLAFEDLNDYNQKLGGLDNLIFEYPGPSTVVIYLRKEKAMKKLSAEKKITWNEKTKKALEELLGHDNVKTRIIGV